MSDHLPECPQIFGKPDWYCCEDCDPGVWADCICDRLRACERRVREDDKNTFLRAAYDTGREDALDAAQEAIRNREDGDYFPWVQVEIAVAAIEALRGGE